jgi:hypothetical protein
VNPIAVSTASIWQKNGRRAAPWCRQCGNSRASPGYLPLGDGQVAPGIDLAADLSVRCREAAEVEALAHFVHEIHGQESERCRPEARAFGRSGSTHSCYSDRLYSDTQEVGCGPTRTE